VVEEKARATNNTFAHKNTTNDSQEKFNKQSHPSKMMKKFKDYIYNNVRNKLLGIAMGVG
jgi:hypothetical protein